MIPGWEDGKIQQAGLDVWDVSVNTTIIDTLDMLQTVVAVRKKQIHILFQAGCFLCPELPPCFVNIISIKRPFGDFRYANK
jgi:hypothetical protein